LSQEILHHSRKIKSSEPVANQIQSISGMKNKKYVHEHLFNTSSCLTGGNCSVQKITFANVSNNLRQIRKAAHHEGRVNAAWSRDARQAEIAPITTTSETMTLVNTMVIDNKEISA
jgi:hypothetical protein